jgi:acetyl esterase
MATDRSVILPGRLGSPEMVLRDDPRVDPRLIATMAPLGIGGEIPAPPVDADSPLDVLLDYISASEEGFETLASVLMADLPPVVGVTSTFEVIRGVDGNDIVLFVHRPARVEEPLPAVVHLHGGSMVMIEAASVGCARWRDELAAVGLVVVGVEFRNGGGKLGPHPFPAGLNDCASALQWLSDNRARLGVSTIVVSGESGGGNLALATALKAKQDGCVDDIDGVYALCPSISNAYATKTPELPSPYENDGYFITCHDLAINARVYDPAGGNATNPLAWPYFASAADLQGLPPHVISVNELDPLRDEGLAFFRKLLAAGVSALSRTVNGTTHAGDVMLRGSMSDVHLATVRDIKSFADSL